MFGVTLCRNNQGDINKLVGRLGNSLIAAVSLIETVAALAFSALAILFYPFDSSPFEHATKWLSSSAFTIGWSVADSLMHIFCHTLVADEMSARRIFHSRDLGSILLSAWV